METVTAARAAWKVVFTTFARPDCPPGLDITPRAERIEVSRAEKPRESLNAAVTDSHLSVDQSLAA